VAKDPADIFDDLNRLRRASGAGNGAPQGVSKGRGGRRAPTKETFVRIPYERVLQLYGRVGAPALFVLFEIDHLIFKARGQNPVRLTNKNLRAIGMPRNTKARALRQLQDAGVITIERRGKEAVLVTLSWYPVSSRGVP
jgi:DNA-binding transcriptional ArsR family regulator